jgi:DNA-binding SARP family transcriptional activator/tetratricopeptide (TPR) repeat protein
MTNDARLLGVPQFPVGETWHDVPLTKASALLCYLAYAQDWVSRDELLYLFYPDTAEQPARANLRQLLTSLRRLPYGEGLDIEDSRLRYSIETDVNQFKQAIHEEKWTKALELYQGELLHGFQAHDLSEFDNWLSLERQTLHTSWRKASLNFATELATTERSSLAVEVLSPLHKADPLDEEILRVYLESLYSSHQKTEALEIFTTFRNTLHHELSSEPEGKTLELITLIQAEKPLKATSSVAVKTRVTEAQKTHHNLPVQVTEFVGRDLEKTKLTELLAEKTCRLLTIVAPGGMGKTRLAIEVAATQLEHFDNVCFVSFAAVASPDLMVYTLADGLELSLFGSKPPKEQVLDYLKNKKMLLVLDNLEHLLSGVDFLSEILATAPNIKILATSRERLGLQSEHLFDLYGLTVPDSNSSDADSFDALHLFAERAKHNRLEFVLEHNLQAVTRICQLVGGMPLAIELAASWSQLLSPREIVNELEQNLDILATSTKDLPQRHHDMRSVFEVSWQRLSEEEQTALRKLSVFQGGFTREAARAVTELDLPVLLSLVNKSFVWRDTLGRFSQHPLILQYLQQKANDYPEERKQIEEKHGLYYLELVKERAEDLRTLKGKEARVVLDDELPNIHVAWDWTLREKRVEEIKHYARDLGFSFQYYNDHEGLEMFKQAVAALDESNPEHHAALGYALIQQAWHEDFLERDTNEITQRGLALLEPLNEYPGIVTGYITLGDLTFARGDFTKAQEICTAALGLARTYGTPSDIGWVLNRLAIIQRELGSFSEVSALIDPTLKELRELGDTLTLSYVLTAFGAYLVYNNKLDEGELLLLESLDLGQKIAIVPPPTLTDLARLAYKRGDFQRAETFAQEAFETASKFANEFMKATSLAILGRVKLAQGQLGDAEYFMIESLRLGWIADTPLAVSHTLVFLAELNIAKRSVKQGVTLLSFLSHYRVIVKRDRNEVLKLLEKAKEHLSPRAFSQAQEASKSLTLEQIVTGILEREIRPVATSRKSRQGRDERA